MKILLDHNLDRRLKKYLPNHLVFTAYEQSWADISNGKLLSVAEENGFEILLTADTHIKNQQNLSNRKISIIVLRATSNRLADHLQMVRAIEIALECITAGEILEILPAN